jgi:hypothetical protein
LNASAIPSGFPLAAPTQVFIIMTPRTTSFYPHLDCEPGFKPTSMMQMAEIAAPIYRSIISYTLQFSKILHRLLEYKVKMSL